MPMYGYRTCDVPGCDRPAKVKLTVMQGGEPHTQMLCAEHSREMSPLHKRSDKSETIQGLFASLLKEKGEGEAATKPDSEESRGKRCPTCDLAFETYRKTFLLGCPDCYDAFESDLVTDLRKIHGETRHRGKVAPGHTLAVERSEAIEARRRALADAVRHEDFETAARLRDEIRDLEVEQTPPES